MSEDQVQEPYGKLFVVIDLNTASHGVNHTK